MRRNYEDTYHARSREQGTHSYLSTDHIVSSYRKNVVQPWIESLPGKWYQKRALLDLASGSGEFSRKVSGVFLKVVSTDISQIGLELTPGKRRVRAGFLDLPFANQSFAGIHCKDALVHVPHLNRFFSETSRVLVPGGKFLLVSHHNDTTEQRSIGGNQTAMYYCWTEDELLGFAEKHGLTLVSLSQWMESNGERDWYMAPKLRQVYTFEKSEKNNDRQSR